MILLLLTIQLAYTFSGPLFFPLPHNPTIVIWPFSFRAEILSINRIEGYDAMTFPQALDPQGILILATPTMMKKCSLASLSCLALKALVKERPIICASLSKVRILVEWYYMMLKGSGSKVKAPEVQTAVRVSSR